MVLVKCCRHTKSRQRLTLLKFSISISITIFWNLMFIIAATVSSWDRIRVGPKMTPRLDTVIRLNWLWVETLQGEDKPLYLSVGEPDPWPRTGRRIK